MRAVDRHTYSNRHIQKRKETKKLTEYVEGRGGGRERRRDRKTDRQSLSINKEIALPNPLWAVNRATVSQTVR